jgi:hypothetical protein
MSKTIFLRVGDRDTIMLPDLVTSLSSFMHLLRDFDATVSGDRRGTQRWEVTTITKDSPVIIGVTPEPKPRMPDSSEAIETHLLESSRALTERRIRTREMSDSALQGIKQIAGLSRRIGASSIYVPANGHARLEAPINEQTMQVVVELTGVRYEAYGTISGALEVISVHRGKDEFRIWDETTGKVVRCKYKGDEFHHRKNVSVSGVILSNSMGEPISITAEELEEKLETQDTFDIRRMAGSAQGSGQSPDYANASPPLLVAAFPSGFVRHPVRPPLGSGPISRLPQPWLPRRYR